MTERATAADDEFTDQSRWIMERVFPNRHGGYFVEAGACIGVRGSNTYLLERDRGWTGLCVEPHPGLYAELVKNRRCATVNCCLTTDNEDVEFMVNPELPGTSGIRDTLAPTVKEAFYHQGQQYETIQVPGRPLWELLREYDAPRIIDYFSLDIEGAEYEAMRGFPFDEYTFAALTIERGSKDYLALRRLLLDRGYRLVNVHASDDFWVHHTTPYALGLQEKLRVAARCTVQQSKAALRPRR